MALSFGKAEEKVLPEEVQRKFWRGRPSSPMTSRGFEGTLAGRGASRYSFCSRVLHIPWELRESRVPSPPNACIVPKHVAGTPRRIRFLHNIECINYEMLVQGVSTACWGSLHAAKTGQ